jgi:hypothetical protein
MAKNKKQSSSSSSSDEDDERLQQLRDSVITFESLKASSEQASKTQSNELKSKRSTHEESECNHNLDEDSDDLNNFKVTSEFQQFVAKKLTKRLDE